MANPYLSTFMQLSNLPISAMYKIIDIQVKKMFTSDIPMGKMQSL